MTGIMIDIETLDTEPTALIIQVGACQMFVPEGGERRLSLSSTDWAYDAVTGKGIIPDEAKSPLTVSTNTLNWWNRQSNEAKESLKLQTCSLKRMLERLNEFFSLCGFYNKLRSDTVWANDPQFDLTILRHAYKVFDLEVPWSFRQERSYRTIRMLGSDALGLPDARQGTAHRADHDALNQALEVEHWHAGILEALGNERP